MATGKPITSDGGKQKIVQETDTVYAGTIERSGGSDDLTFTARGASITVNESGDPSLSGFTATSIVGALNEAKSDFSSMDHGNLAGLSDDDHTQYHTDTRGDARYRTQTELSSTTGGSEGAALVGTDTKTNLGSATTAEAALTATDAHVGSSSNPHGVTLDGAYDADAGAASVTADAGDLTVAPTGAYSVNVDLGAATGTADGFQIYEGVSTEYFRVIRKDSNTLDLESAMRNVTLGGSGVIKFEGNTRVGASGTPGSATGSADLYVNGKLEIDGIAEFDDDLRINAHTFFHYGNAGGFRYTADDGLHLFVYGEAANQQNRNLIITDYTNRNADHNHSTLRPDPTLILHSVTAPGTADTQYGALAHNQTDFEISTGTGAVAVKPAIESNIRDFKLDGTNSFFNLRVAEIIKDHTSDLFDAAATTDNAVVWQQPANTLLLAAKFRLDEQFDTIGSLAVTVGDSGDTDGLIEQNYHNLVTASVGAEFSYRGNYWDSSASADYMSILPGLHEWKGYASGGDNLDTMTQGQVTFYFLYIQW
jgi:hypothetical protein